MNKTQLSFTICLLWLTITANSFAAVYRGDVFTYTQPDGSTFDIQLWGDEDYADEETVDGWRIVRDPTTKFWCYARLSANNLGLESTGVVVGQGNPVTLGIAKHLRIDRAERLRLHRQRQSSRNRDERGRPMKAMKGRAVGDPNIYTAPPSTTTVGSRRGLTLLLRFPDQLADATISQTQVSAYCNQESGYTGFGNNGSVRSYFYDVSGGKLIYTNHVAEYLTAANNRDYYTDSSISYGTRARALIIEALVALENAGFDFRSVDADGDLRIDALNCFYAGTRINNWAEGLWPHASSLSWMSTSTSVSAGNYQITDMGTSLTLGTFCHENGHMLCDYPDLYDYDGDSSGGAGLFCLMNSGGHGTNPSAICGYLRYKSGWGTATTINANTNTLATLTAHNSNLMLNEFLRHAKNSTEYYLIENRFKNRRDAQLPTGGIAIWHVDELGNHNDQRYAHQSTHHNYEAALIQADNLRELERDLGSDADDLFYSGNASGNYTGTFNDSSDASLYDNNAHWWDGTNSGMKLSNFSVRGNSMTLLVGSGALTVTSPNGAEILTAGASHTITWTTLGTVGNVTLAISTNGGTGWVDLETNTPNDGSQSVTLPAVSSSACLVRISQTSGSTIIDTSNAFFTLSGASRECDLARSGTPISDGGTDVLSSSIAGVASSLIYTISNPGGSGLNVSSPTVGTLNNCTVTITVTPSATVAAGANSSMTIQVTPNAVGTWNAPLSMVNNDADENPYNWTLSGTAIAQPIANLKRGSITINDESVDATGVAATTTRSFSYRILNEASNGSQSLTLSGSPLIVISSLSNCSAIVSDQPITTIAPGYNAPFIIQVTPTAAGTWSYAASITNNDLDRNPYNWTVSGTHVAPPNITLQPQNESLANGLSTTLTVNATGGELSYQWYEGTSGITTNPKSGENSTSYTTPSLTVSGNYWVRVSNIAGVIDSNTAIITVAPPPAAPAEKKKCGLGSFFGFNAALLLFLRLCFSRNYFTRSYPIAQLNSIPRHHTRSR